MDEDINFLEREKLRLENEKLKREIELNPELRLIELEQRKIEEDKNRQKRDFKRSIAALVLTAFSILVSAIITIFSFISTKSINEATNKINEETLLQTKLERIDKLKSEYDDSLTSIEHKSSIAFELIKDTLLLSGYDRDRLIKFYTAFQFAEDTRQEISKAETLIKPQEVAKLDKAEIKQVVLENKLIAESNPEQRTRIEGEIRSIAGNLPVTQETKKIAKQIDTLSAVQKEMSRTEKESSTGQTLVTWFKENYFRPYGEIIVTLEVLVENERRGSVSVRGKNPDSQKQMIQFTVPAKRTVTYNNISYELDFIKIDRAGKNPFTKAVWFSVSQLPGKQK